MFYFVLVNMNGNVHTINRFKFSDLSAIPFACIIVGFCSYYNDRCGNGRCYLVNRKVTCFCDPDRYLAEYETIALGELA